MKRTVLLVPGFVADTYSEIEQAYVELSAAAKGTNLDFIWLVPEIGWKYNNFKRPENRTLLTHPVCVPHLYKHNVRFTVANLSKANIVRNFFVFRRLFSEFHIDAVYTHFGFERFWAAFFGKLWGKVTIWNEHWHSLGTRYIWPKRIFYRFFVDEFIAISQFIKTTLPRASRVHVVPNAIHADVVEPCDETHRARCRARLGISGGARIVLMVAGFRPEKRHYMAVEICERVSRARDDVVFVFLGDGKTRGAFLQQIERRGLAQQVVAPGHVDNVGDYYAIADVCMLTSYNDGFGYCVLEAMRHGRPMVAFDNGGPAEVLRSGNAGVLIEDLDVETFARALLDLLENAPRRDAMGEAGRDLVRKDYSRAAWIRRLNELIESIISDHQRPKPRRNTKPMVQANSSR